MHYEFSVYKNVATLKLDAEKCTGCAICTDVCPRQVLKMNERKVEIINLNNCIECGACSKNCPFSAITVESGVGCAAAIYFGILNNSAPRCDCSKSGCC